MGQMAHQHDRRRGGFQFRLGDCWIILGRQTRHALRAPSRPKMRGEDFRRLLGAQNTGVKNRRHLRLASRGRPRHLLDLLLSKA